MPRRCEAPWASRYHCPDVRRHSNGARKRWCAETLA